MQCTFPAASAFRMVASACISQLTLQKFFLQSEARENIQVVECDVGAWKRLKIKLVVKL